MAVSWSKSWSASDDGTVLGGNDLGNIQNDIDGAMDEAVQCPETDEHPCRDDVRAIHACRDEQV